MKKRIKIYIQHVSELFKCEPASGILLFICAVIAIIIANSSYSTVYSEVLHTNISIGYKEYYISMSLAHWINDGLMAIFFFVVGMEIKKEVLIGELRSLKTTILPIAAALGGMIVPAIVYLAFNYNQGSIHGFGIPMATDIAFALGVLSLVGQKAPKGIVIFLTALAVVDDLGAIIVIAVFYTNQISWFYLVLSVIILLVLILANRCNVQSQTVFILLGIMLWFTVLKTGIHATFAGVLLGLIIPGSKDSKNYSKTMLYKLEHTISPWSSYVIMPIFALSNAGVILNKSSFSSIMSTPVSLGIILGLILGKQVGIYSVSILLIKLKIAKLPSGVNKKHLYAASVLGGIGFTMSIFISSLTFTEEAILSTAKISIIVASLVSAIFGYILFRCMKSDKNT
ncbi:Na+/H+ antiporter NhaA [Anaeromicropila herbilytica]|uniref:Na(+)/H(+) antiporter NhaA n=1 Tax=Anaeromicropila herbilytica TaxID=2785025 RepID=A0A7R7ELM0_9FIRM|nr:Na+/H+ antiporter NhaA [Anaeromicropila herbilytica]BCN30767.1 Na(+)/H(+) antiporter NhaA [Anaeromicropila herbilytica]